MQPFKILTIKREDKYYYRLVYDNETSFTFDSYYPSSCFSIKRIAFPEIKIDEGDKMLTIFLKGANFHKNHHYNLYDSHTSMEVLAENVNNEFKYATV